jgi:hypothetical protein
MPARERKDLLRRLPPEAPLVLDRHHPRTDYASLPGDLFGGRLTVVIPSFAGIFTINYGAQAAAAIVVTVPLVILVLSLWPYRGGRQRLDRDLHHDTLQWRACSRNS